MNGGKCETTGPSSYICKCGDRYRGAKCEVDTDPCRERPCLNNGKIISQFCIQLIGNSALFTVAIKQIIFSGTASC